MSDPQGCSAQTPTTAARSIELLGPHTKPIGKSRPHVVGADAEPAEDLDRH